MIKIVRSKNWNGQALVSARMSAIFMSHQIDSPWDYLRHTKLPIRNIENLILILAIQGANMTAFINITSDDSSRNMCLETQLELAWVYDIAALPFGFDSKKNLYNFVTCSGHNDEGYSLEIIFAPFHWKLWVSIVSCAFLLLIYIACASQHWDFKSIVESGFSIVLGAFGYDISNLTAAKNKLFLCLLLLWSLIGILVGNLYQARLTEYLIVPEKYSPHESLEELVNRNFTILLMLNSNFQEIPTADLKSSDLENYWFSRCMNTLFCKQIIHEQFQSMISADPSGFGQNCLTGILRCKKLFAGKSHLMKFPQLIMTAKNYSFLMNKLSTCSKNVAFIHNRLEMHHVVKPKLPNVARFSRREFKYIDLPEDTIQTSVVLTCLTDGAHLIQPIVMKYVEHGLHTSWANVASMLAFHWTSGTNTQQYSDEAKFSKLDEKFVSIFFTVLAAYAVAMIVLVIENCLNCCKDGKWTKYFSKNSESGISVRFLIFFLRLKNVLGELGYMV